MSVDDLTVSVVVPCLNEAFDISKAIGTLERLHAPHEIIVVDGGSEDGTADLAARYRTVQLVRCQRGRGRQMNAGARRATGDVMLFLHADARLPAEGLPMIRRSLTLPTVAGGCFTLQFDRNHLLLKVFAACSRINHPLFTYGDQGFFVRRDVFERLGGFAEMEFLEDVEFQDRLRRVGRFVKLPAPVTTSARRFLAGGVLRQQLRNAAIVAAYRLGVPAETLKKCY